MHRIYFDGTNFQWQEDNSFLRLWWNVKIETSLPAKSITAPIIMENMDLDKTDVEITLLSAWEEFGRHFVCTLVWGGWASQVPKYKEYKPWNQSFNYSTKWRIISTKIQLRAPASCHRLPSSLIEQEITLKKNTKYLEKLSGSKICLSKLTQ